MPPEVLFKSSYILREKDIDTRKLIRTELLGKMY